MTDGPARTGSWFLLGAAYAALGLGLSTLAAWETRGQLRTQQGRPARQPEHAARFTFTSFKELALSAACQAGLVDNNDGVAWACSRFCSLDTALP